MFNMGYYGFNKYSKRCVRMPVYKRFNVFGIDIFFKTSKGKENYTPFNRYCKIINLGDEAVDLLQSNYQFIRINSQGHYLYQHHWTKETIEIDQLGVLFSGRLDTFDYELDELDRNAW